MVDIVHQVGIKAPDSKVYEALATIQGLAGWWTETTTGVTAPGGAIDFVFHQPNGALVGAIQMTVVALTDEKLVHWRCTGGAEEWIGTDIVFKLSVTDDYTIVRFGHRNWREETEFTEFCSMKWATFLMSLKNRVETGQGRPAPNDVRISNWH